MFNSVNYGQGTDPVQVTSYALRTDLRRGSNVVLGWWSTEALADESQTHDNLFVGEHAGSGATHGAENVVVGNYPGAPDLSGALVLADAGGRGHGIRWLDGNPNAIQSVGPEDAPLSEDNTMSLTFDPEAMSLRARVCVDGRIESVTLGGGDGGGDTADLRAKMRRLDGTGPHVVLGRFDPDAAVPTGQTVVSNTTGQPLQWWDPGTRSARPRTG